MTAGLLSRGGGYMTGSVVVWVREIVTSGVAHPFKIPRPQKSFGCCGRQVMDC